MLKYWVWLSELKGLRNQTKLALLRRFGDPELMRNKVFKNRNTTSNVAYVINMMVMGFWHGVTWYYIAYGIFHGIGLGINDAWLRKKKTINKERKKAGLEPLPENKWTKALGIFITFNTVMLSFLIFSGFLNDLWFTKK